MFATTYPWFRLLWFRIILVLITAGSGVFELAAGNPGWVFVILAMAVWFVWALFDIHDSDAAVRAKANTNGRRGMNHSLK